MPVDDLALMRALGIGLAIESLVSPEAVRPDLYGDFVESLVGLVRARGEAVKAPAYDRIVVDYSNSVVEPLDRRRTRRSPVRRGERHAPDGSPSRRASSGRHRARSLKESLYRPSSPLELPRVLKEDEVIVG